MLKDEPLPIEENKLHSFAVLAYKDSPYLEECILSLKNQTVQSDIYITTATPSEFLENISRKYGIRLIINRNSGGIASDWSFAYDCCKTEYLTLAHQDDIYLPGYTELCLKAARKYIRTKQLIIFTGYKDFIGPKVRNFTPHLFVKKILLLPFMIKQNIASAFIKKLVLSFGSPIPCPTVMYHKKSIGEFRFAGEFSCNMDWDAWLRLANEKGSFVYVRPKLVLHRIHKEAQTSLKISSNVRQKEDYLIFQRLWPKAVAVILFRIYSFSTRFSK